ncbi:TauD/TfdA dioxygenase family protein [Bauldia litoralis]|uniref:Taurine dioxygenase n=1 Tax=Bauldia litoralis TaxID=665467 RepID=A0A1G6BQV4_9HYPH|nr:TauD/TfdA family dioxygenase [Bauldia litoralis]SDB22967.1 taurine dioxygenase [Bauldia litoralis]
MFTTRRLSETFGMAIEGVDLSRPLADDEFRAVEQAFFDGQILAIKGQSLEPGAFVDFARRFGPPQPHVIDQFHYPDHPDILILSNGKENGRPIGLADGGSYFHTDYSYLAVPARVTILYSVAVPKQGGNTLFANMYAAYDDLPEATRERIDDLVVLHHYGNRDDLDETSRTAASPLSEAQKGKVDWVRHKLVRTHPGTGRKALYAVSGSSFEVEGMPKDEGVQLLDDLKAHALQDRYIYSYAYEKGDVVLWDDLATLHSATLTDPNDLRTLWRITVIEEA